MAIVPGKPVTPSSIADLDLTAASIEVLTLDPSPGAASQTLIFNEGYSVYVDNAGAGADNSRLWLDAPDDGEIIIGPRSGTSHLASVRLKTDATTASAANCFINSSTQQISRSTSSRRYKVNIADAEIDIDAIGQLRPVRFQDRGEHSQLGDEAPWYVGLVAEEVHETGLTEFVAYMDTEDGPVPDGVQYDRLTLGLLQLVRQQSVDLGVLRNRVDRLEQLIATLPGVPGSAEGTLNEPS